MGRCVAGQTKTIGIELGSVANAGKFQVNPTLDAADFRISINGGAFAALTNTPTVTPSGGAQVQVVLAAAETTSAGAGGRIHLRCSDSSGGEWQDLAIDFEVFATAEETGVTLADGAITAAKIATDAIDADSIKADAVTKIQNGLATLASLFGYDMESGKTFAQAVLDIWATRVGDATRNSADYPFTADYDSPDGTVQVSHVHASALSRTLE